MREKNPVVNVPVIMRISTIFRFFWMPDYLKSIWLELSENPPIQTFTCQRQKINAHIRFSAMTTLRNQRIWCYYSTPHERYRY